MQRLEVSGGVRHIHIYVIRRLKVNSIVRNECTRKSDCHFEYDEEITEEIEIKFHNHDATDNEFQV
jgi:hypothetical protein